MAGNTAAESEAEATAGNAAFESETRAAAGEAAAKSEADARWAVAIVGAGVIGRIHAEAVRRHPKLRVGAIVDPDPAARRKLAEQIAQAEQGAENTAPAEFATLPEALATGGIDIVAVCVPTGLHAAAITAALAAGVHVLVEKPIDVSLPEARRLTALAEEAAQRGVLCSVISQHRFDPASAAVAAAVAGGQMGRITSAVASVAWWRGQEYYDSAQWRGTWALDGGGALMNQGVHTVDLLAWLLGKPVEVFAHAAMLAHEGIEVEDVAVATVRFASGALAVLHATTAAYPGLSVRLQVHGTTGSAVLHDDQLEYFHVARHGTGATGGPYGGAEPDNQASRVVPAAELRGNTKPADAFVVGHLRQYEDVVDAIGTGRPPAVTMRDGLLAVALVRAVYVSATLGRPVDIDALLAGDYDDVAVAIDRNGGISA
ncbi:Gfo/Idh/MocA family protein [Catenulispora pinisilvae]|uniref:Gfo/Idh/MocA family protein n=1 Tax=Catenulispora pinisilvae TaxID=2705253 RepID=UPI00189219BF|nr:Gfo/Idh/MocA family oxidoreductase [Catenulispora pinisilvae]